MLRKHIIHDTSLPGLAPFLTLRQTGEHREQGYFVCQGEKNVSRLLGSPFRVVSMIMTEEWFERLRPLWEVRSEEIEVYVGPRELLQKVIGFKLYQPLMAVGKIPAAPTLGDVLMTSARPYLFVAVDGISNADNLGGLMRNCGAFGAHALVVDSTSCSPFLRRSVRASMGAIFAIPILRAPRLVPVLQELGDRGIRRVASFPDTDRLDLAAVDLRGDTCLVFGSEGYGISAAVLEHCDERAAIPMHPNMDSLNVAHAAAVFLYEAVRQRGFPHARPTP